jgi:hypothetical protein
MNFRAGLLLLLCLGARQSFGQTGFFLLMDKSSKCTNTALSMDKKTEYCITPEPIIEEKEFSIASNISFNLSHTEKYFNLKLTNKALSVWKLLARNMSDKLVFVVDGRAVGFFSGGKIAGQIISISGKGDTNDIDWVYEKLKARAAK